MKKCVKCGRKYDDLVSICNVCDLYLIKDVVSEIGKKEMMYKSCDDTFSTRERNSQSPVRNTRRKNRVVQQVEETEKSVSNNTVSRTVFTSSDEDEIKPVYETDIQRSRRRRRQPNRLGRNVLPIMRIVIPILLIIVATMLIVVNWDSIREFLRACIIGGLIGGGMLTFFSLRFGRYFSPDVVTVGLFGGAVVGCILKYNLLGTTVELSELIDALMPCVISCAGIWLMLRSIFTRR